MADHPTSEFGRQIGDVTERVSTLVREEIELAKAEMTVKVSSIAKGAVFGIVASVFAVFALIYLAHGFALAINDLLNVTTALWAGYLITGILILLFGLIAAFFAQRLVKRGFPPKPEMALEEASKIRGTLKKGDSVGTAVATTWPAEDKANVTVPGGDR